MDILMIIVAFYVGIRIVLMLLEKVFEVIPEHISVLVNNILSISILVLIFTVSLISGLMAAVFLVAASAGLYGLGYLYYSRTEKVNLTEKYASAEINYKKYPETDLKRFSAPFLRSGTLIALVTVILAFGYTEDTNRGYNLDDLALPDDLEIEPPQTKQEKPPPPPPPPPKLEVVEDEEILDEDEPEFEDVEIDEETEVEVAVEEEVIDEPDIFIQVEEMPAFPGGEAEMTNFIRKNMKYPPIAIDNSIEGLVVLTFVVGTDGSITDIKILRDIGGGCGKAAVAVVKRMPKWSPGRQRGKAVKVQFNLPVRFTLAN